MAAVDPRTPVIVGVGQITNRRERIVQPLDLMEEAARAAAEDAGGSVLPKIGSVQVVNVMSYSYPNAPQALADKLGVPGGERIYTTAGGNTPQWLMARVCDAIAAGEYDGAIVAGAEAFDSARQAAAQGRPVDRGDRNAPSDVTVIGDSRSPMTPADMAARLLQPTIVYPLYESALAAKNGRSLDEQREFLGGFMAPFTKVAASHPDDAWFPVERTPEEISSLRPDNRYICEPYPKLMNAIMQVDQGAAFIVMSAEAAEAAGVPKEKWVFPWAGAECTDVFKTAERPTMDSSPAINACGKRGFEAAGVGVDDVKYIDLYSCFPCAVEVAAEEIGIAFDDPRGLTVTGGLPYFGGAGNNYVSHSITVMTRKLRQDPGALGMLTGNGWYLTKHSLGIYSTEPPPGGWKHADTKAEQQAIDDGALEVATDADAEATVEAFTVQHGRESGPEHAPLFARLADGRRVVASAADASIAAEVSGGNIVGKKVRVRPAENGSVYELV